MNIRYFFVTDKTEEEDIKGFERQERSQVFL